MNEVKTLKDLMDDTLHNMLQGCYNFTKKGECSKCGQCCSTLLPLKKSEIEELKRIIKVRNIKAHEQPKVLAVNVFFDLTCPFLTDDNKCSIYEDRPFICRVFKCDQKPSLSDLMSIDERLEAVNLRDLF